MTIDESRIAARSEPANTAPTRSDGHFCLNAAGLRRPWILGLGQVRWMTPSRIFAASALILGSASYLAGMPLLTPIIMAYLLGITNFVVKRQQQELRRLRPVLTCDDDTFANISFSLSHHRRVLLHGTWVVGPILMLIVNLEGPNFIQFFNGGTPTPGLLWGIGLAWISWVALCQALVVLFSNSLCFAKIGASFASIDLLDTGSLVPFARVGARNLLIFVGGYTLIPIVYFDGSVFFQIILAPLAVTLPVAVLLLLLPMHSIRARVGNEKDLELDRIQKAMHGNRDALAESPIAGDADSIGFTDLVLYRQMISDVNEWPVDYPIFVRLSLYIVIPLLTWIGAALVEQFVDFVLGILPVS